MELIRCRHNISERHHGCVVSIGNFDGVHRGHQDIIGQLKQAAISFRMPVTIILFEPQPQEYFLPDRAPARLMRLRDKVRCLDYYGVDRVVCLRFDSELADLAPEDFVRDVLVRELGVGYVAVGDDFRFGRDRGGDFSLLEKLGKENSFRVERTEIAKFRERRVSSSWIREAFAEGNVPLATRLLGHPYTISGRIIHGDKKGRELGYPTINLNLHRLQSPVTGIFVSRVHDLIPAPVNAVTSIGTRPVFDGKQVLLESHLLDFDETVYGRYVRVELLEQIRHEQDFTNIDELTRQIGRDIKVARRWFEQDKS
ncbi:MAG TPA: bifunctional riboflavin kinase/FAD synthetase [Gammaproteobacteria bacterium]|nr:bifunctional riboflavin kinase/FAD synthetase [Gammaproteobacteria bacterium]